jgi:hypothetical protein
MINIHDAVYAVYTNAVTARGNDVNSLIVEDINGHPITIVPATVTAKLAELQAAETVKQEAEVVAKQSAISKLSALGLTQAEVTALVG